MKSARKILMLTSFLAVTSLTQAVVADVDTPRIDQRQANQQQRIEQGVTSGELTQREAARLQNQQMRIEHMEEAAKADGEVTKGERARITHRQNEAGRAITRKKHNLRNR